MRRSFAPLALSALLCFASHAAWADSSSEISVGMQQAQLTPAVKRALHDVGKMFDARDGLSSFHAEYRSVAYVMDDKGDFSPYTVTVSGEMQKPNKMNLKLTHGTEAIGSVVSDGVTVTYYNAGTNTYARFPAPASYDITRSLGATAGKKLNESDADKNTADAGDDASDQTPQEKAESDAAGVFGEDDDQQEPVVEALGAAEFLLRKSTEGEAESVWMCLGDATQTVTRPAGSTGPVEVVDLSLKADTSSTASGQKTSGSSSVTMHFAFDEASGMPGEWSLVTTMNFGGGATTIHSYDYRFTSITPSQAPFPDADFAWSAPAGAKVYQKPKDADPIAGTPK